MREAFVQFVENKLNRSFDTFEAFHEWSCTDPTFWRLIDDYFETRNLNTKLDFYLKPRLETNLSGVEVNPFPENSSLYENRYKPNKSVNPAKYCLEGFFSRARGKAPAFIEVSEDQDTRKYSFNELLNEVATFQKAIEKRKIHQGDRLLYLGPFTFKSFALFLACMANGIVWSSAGSEIGRSELQYRIDALKPSLVIFNEKYTYKSMSFSQASFLTQIHTTGLAYMEIGLLQQGCNKVQAKSMSFSALAYDFPSLILFTSGSTGRPKPLLMTLTGIILQLMKEIRFHYRFETGDVFYYQTTWGWNMWQWQLAAFALGSPFISYLGAPAYPQQRDFIDKFIDLDVTIFGASPSLYKILLNVRAHQTQSKNQR